MDRLQKYNLTIVHRSYQFQYKQEKEEYIPPRCGLCRYTNRRLESASAFSIPEDAVYENGNHGNKHEDKMYQKYDSFWVKND